MGISLISVPLHSSFVAVSLRRRSPPRDSTLCATLLGVTFQSEGFSLSLAQSFSLLVASLSPSFPMAPLYSFSLQPPPLPRVLHGFLDGIFRRIWRRRVRFRLAIVLCMLI